MSALRFAVFGKSRLAAARCHALARTDEARIVRTWSSEQVSSLTDAEWQSLLAPEDMDAVIFALEPDVSAHAARIALTKGIHVLSELPGGCTVEDVVELRRAERESGAILKFGCGLRYHGSVQEALARIETGELGRLLTVRATYGHAGLPAGLVMSPSILIGHGIYLLDLLHLFCGPFETVKAMSDGPPEESGNVFAILRAGSGTLVQLHSSATSWRQTFRVELGFEHGYIWLDGHLPGLEGYGPEMLIHAKVDRTQGGDTVANPSETVLEFADEASAQEELREFLAAIAGTADLTHGTSHQAFDAVNIAHRICAACETWA
ncbi:MAG: Gfo/Idh/MocA family oxidoreductase [Henriciella sp.]